MGRKKKEKLLLEKIREGDEETFKTVFLKYYDPLTQYLWSYVRSEALAKEITQEVFAKLWDSRAEIDKDGHLRGFLYEMARNKALDYIKHQKIANQYLEEAKKRGKAKKHQEGYRKEKNKILVGDIEDAVNALPPKARQIFKLNRDEGLTYKEIAEYLDISVKTVETHMRRVFKKLRKRLSKYSPIFLMLYQLIKIFDLS